MGFRASLNFFYGFLAHGRNFWSFYLRLFFLDLIFGVRVSCFKDYALQDGWTGGRYAVRQGKGVFFPKSTSKKIWMFFCFK